LLVPVVGAISLALEAGSSLEHLVPLHLEILDAQAHGLEATVELSQLHIESLALTLGLAEAGGGRNPASAARARA
jgi:hypothetical protein